MRLARLATPLLALVALSGCHLYFGDGREDDIDGGPPRVDAPFFPDAWWIDAPTDGPVGPDAPPAPRPTAPMRAHVLQNGAWIDQGLADWSCMGTPTSDLPSTGPMTLSGRVVDYPAPSGIGGASIIAYAPSTSMVVGTGMTSTAGATRGAYTMSLQQLPSTSRRFTFAITAQNYPGTYLLEQYIPPAATAMRDLSAISTATLSSLHAYVGAVRDPANVMALGTIVDCQGRSVSNAMVVASRSRSTTDVIAGARAYYYSASSTSVPVRNDQMPFSNVDGKFMVVDVPPITAGFAVQIQGFRTQAELDANTIRLVAQVWAPANSGTVSLAPYEPRRAGQ